MNMAWSLCHCNHHRMVLIFQSISNQYVDSYKALLQTCSAMVMKQLFWVIMVEIFSCQETNNSDLQFFWGTLMIYGENVKVAKCLQSADLITEWVIQKCVGLSYYYGNDHSELLNCFLMLYIGKQISWCAWCALFRIVIR